MLDLRPLLIPALLAACCVQAQAQAAPAQPTTGAAATSSADPEAPKKLKFKTKGGCSADSTSEAAIQAAAESRTDSRNRPPAPRSKE